MRLGSGWDGGHGTAHRSDAEESLYGRLDSTAAENTCEKMVRNKMKIIGQINIWRGDEYRDHTFFFHALTFAVRPSVQISPEGPGKC